MYVHLYSSRRRPDVPDTDGGQRLAATMTARLGHHHEDDRRRRPAREAKGGLLAASSEGDRQSEEA